MYLFIMHPLICSMLVNIYGSKDLFVSEYRTLLADRILSSFNYDTEKEVTIKIISTFRGDNFIE